ncbi:MAG: carbohydrate kinase family protein, partial [Kiritimatiellales bacterium]
MTNSKDSFSLDAVVAGYLGVDIAPGFPAGRVSVSASELFRPGKLIETEGLSISLGGVVANTGLAMKTFGRRVELMGCVGCDALGDVVVTRLHEQGVTGGIRRNRRAGTAYGIVVAPPGMDRIFFEDPGCNGVFTSDDIDYETVAKSRLFHFG